MWSTPDLSDISQVLKGLLESALNQAAVTNIKVHMESPDTSRSSSDGYCHLTLYLLHVARDPYWRNTPVSGPRPQLNKSQPLSLNLSYLLTAWHDTDFATEQRAMSIALQCIHSQPIVTQQLIQSEMLTAWLPSGEFVMSIEADTLGEMSALWQAFTVPMRLSALIRVGVVFIAPVAAIPPLAVAPSVANLTVAPGQVAATLPMLTAGAAVQSPPVPPSAAPSGIPSSLVPLVAVGESTVTLAGNGLDQPSAANVFLRSSSPVAEWDVTSWRQGTSQASRLTLSFPSAYVSPSTSAPAPPAATPLPGLYELAVGSGAQRSNSIPLLIAPRIDGVVNPPLLAPDGSGVYTITGAGFVPATTTLTFGTTVLASAASPPGAGQFAVSADGSTVTFKAPAAMPLGSYGVLLAVGGIAASTGWVVVLA